MPSSALPADPAGPPLRLTMAPAGDGHRGALNGAWWPHSRNLPAELPALIAGLDAWLDAAAPGDGAHISRVSINLTAWDAVPAHLEHAGRRVRLAWFGAIDAHTLSATCSDGSHLDLLVVPPQATPERADAATVTATGPANTLCGAAILVRLMPDLLRGPDPTPSWANGNGRAPDRTPGGPVRLLDDGDPDDSEPGPAVATWRRPAAR